MDRRGKAEEKDGIPAWRDRPLIPAHLELFWVSFWELIADRPEGLRAIPFSSFHQFAVRYGMDDVDEFDRFKTLIRALDDTHRKVLSTPPKDLGKGTEV